MGKNIDDIIIKKLNSDSKYETIINFYQYIFAIIKRVQKNSIYYKGYDANFKKSSKLLIYEILEKSDNVDELLNYLDDVLFNYDEEEKSIKILNISLEILFSIDGCLFDRSFFEEVKKLSNNDFISCLNYESKFIDYFHQYEKKLNYLGYTFDSEIKCFVKTENKILVDEINNNKISNLYYLYMKSTSLTEMESHMNNFAKRMLPFISRTKNNSQNELLKIYNKNFITMLARQCNGYFRHTISDGGDKEMIDEWSTFSDEKKIEIMNETISIYISILSYLKMKGYDQLINKDFN